MTQKNIKQEGTMNNFWNDKGLIPISPAGIKGIQGSLCQYIWKFRLNEQMPRKIEFSKTSKIWKRQSEKNDSNKFFPPQTSSSGKYTGDF